MRASTGPQTRARVDATNAQRAQTSAHDARNQGDPGPAMPKLGDNAGWAEYMRKEREKYIGAASGDTRGSATNREELRGSFAAAHSAEHLNDTTAKQPRAPTGAAEKKRCTTACGCGCDKCGGPSLRQVREDSTAR
uniref:Uncharacterized protein n=1 Tax=Neobodo designis TaxID=312471 RepID=A0A7S1LNX4_NEODS